MNIVSFAAEHVELAGAATGAVLGGGLLAYRSQKNDYNFVESAVMVGFWSLLGAGVGVAIRHFVPGFMPQ